MNDDATDALNRIADALELQALTALRDLARGGRLTHVGHRIDQLIGYTEEGE